jgi:undecaprenyl-phosphate 4-deoxy-4-formamido-L-arabinose transferase
MEAFMLYSIVVPVFNSSASLGKLITEIRDHFGEAFCDAASDIEVLLIDDASSDDSWRIIKRLANKYHMIHPMRMSQNVGQQRALYYGLLAARGEYAITIDDDLQHDIREVDKMLELAKEGCDLVFGVYDNYGEHGIRHLGSKWIGSFFRRNYPQLEGNRVSSYRLIQRSLYLQLKPCPGHFVYLSAELLPYACKTGNVKISRRRRAYGHSGYTLRKCIAIGIRLNFHYGLMRKLPFPERKGEHSEIPRRR